MIPVFKFCVIWGIFLTWFADALLFDNLIKTAYEDGVDTHQDLLDRDMTLGSISWHFYINVRELEDINLYIFLLLNVEKSRENFKRSQSFR